MGQEVMEERMKSAVIEACRALRRRHKLEEGAHGPAVATLAKVASSRVCTRCPQNLSNPKLYGLCVCVRLIRAEEMRYLDVIYFINPPNLLLC